MGWCTSIPFRNGEFFSPSPDFTSRSKSTAICLLASTVFRKIACEFTVHLYKLIYEDDSP